MNKRGIRTTVGLPGSGLSFIDQTPWRRKASKPVEPATPMTQPVQPGAKAGPADLEAALMGHSMKALRKQMRRFERQVEQEVARGEEVNLEEFMQARDIYLRAIGARYAAKPTGIRWLFKWFFVMPFAAFLAFNVVGLMLMLIMAILTRI